ncbi:DUF5949 family protein [Streptomyces bambusae]|uniref:DUF5949 family protein n=1 Tax=Streptomyces bambusae TaxID=1550616 RepID=UPI001CFD47EB|nr:DUF5949 family protein [Streptomyces bambusae]MCB5166359.1 DUF5949 family protein [Streptomyces bambusae]
MTSTHTESAATRAARLGTLSVLAWIGDPDEGHDVPYLLAYTLGDGEGGPAAAEAAARELLEEIKLPIGDEVLDGTNSPNFPITVLVEGEQAALTMPGLNAKCSAPPEWISAADESGQVYFLFATRPWPEAVPGRPVTADMLQAFAGNEANLTSSAHIVLPVTKLRK